MVGPRRAAVLGSPIRHSKSPALHKAAYRAAGHGDWSYDAIESTCGDLAERVAEMGPEWLGLSLTMPCKDAGLRVADEVDPVALATGAVNTLVFADRGDHAVRGYNTDVDGIVAALHEAEVAAADRVAVLGAGATARSAVAAAYRLGAGDVDVYARRPAPALEVAALAADYGLGGRARPWSQVRRCIEADVVIATAPAGAADPLAASLAESSSNAVLLDVVYANWPTPLAASWPGPVTVSGLSMLLWQAVEQVRLMAGFSPDVAAMKAAVDL